MSRSGCVGVVLALVLALIACAPSGERGVKAGGDVERARRPVFRGDPSLSGVAEDEVPDSLSLLWSFCNRVG